MFLYRDGKLFCEDVDLDAVARQAGTPCYVYSSADILNAYRAYDEAFDGTPHLICYAVKANSNLAVLSLLARAGSGFDIVSGGELYRVLKAGGDPARVVFSGVGKTDEEMEFGLRQGIACFNCESEAELTQLDRVAGRLGATARFSLRVNPDVDAVTHPYISTGLRDHKFGIDIEGALGVYARSKALPNIQATGVDCHIGSQILDYSSIIEASRKVVRLVAALVAEGHDITHVDFGGGLGIAYRDGDDAPGIADFVKALRAGLDGLPLKVMVEPGRSIVGSAGVLLTRVLQRKRSTKKEFVVVDAAMNDLIRPALYQAHHQILPLNFAPPDSIVADVVGPICETGDFLARDRQMPAVETGDYLAVASAGAYGFVQASNYNSRPRAAEVLVDGDWWRIVRQRETWDDLIKGETV
jgi:diaminopimelate decarboxylase